MWRASDPEGDEAAKVKYDVVRYTRGAVLDFGCGPSKAFPQWLGVDSGKDTALFGIEMRPQVTVDLADPVAIAAAFHEESVDAIFSSHLLEHIEDHVTALKAWWSLIKSGGYLVLYLPHADLYPRIGTEGSNPDHKHDFHPDEISAAMMQVAVASDSGWDLVVNEDRNAGREYSFLQVYRKRVDIDPGCDRFLTSWTAPRPEKSVCVIRHGGIGDQLQAAYLLPELKRQGYHVTVLTTPDGKMPIAYDPHVDDWYLVDRDQVPNPELGYFWRELAKYYDRVVNLNESVEGAFLALPGRVQFMWPQAVRHRHLNVNYAEHAAAIAEIPFFPEGRFYETAEERKGAAERKREIKVKLGDMTPVRTATVFDLRGRPIGQRLENPQELLIGERADPWFFIMWALAGSSVHKWTPWQDAVIAAVLAKLSRAIVITTGDMACKILEAGLEHPRIVTLSGELTVRETLALAKQMDLVIGPETGVLNAVCYEPLPKIALLSHSSPENLTKHWHNTHAIEGVAACYPCHRLHYDATFCPREEQTGAAQCQVGVDPRRIYDPIDREYTGWAKLQLLRGAA